MDPNMTDHDAGRTDAVDTLVSTMVDAASADPGASVLHVLQQLVEPLSTLLGADTEVVLHDVRKLPNSIVAIHGDVTGRQPGDPMTDYLLRQLRGGNLRDVYHYRTALPNGSEGNSTTFGITSEEGELVAVLCVNRDMTRWRQAADLLSGVLADPTGDARATDGEPRTDHPTETFPRSVNELITTSIDSAIARVGIPVDLMKKHHKMSVVAELDAHGIFLIRDSVDTAALALQVTRYTIYNYINQLNEQADPESPAPSGD